MAARVGIARNVSARSLLQVPFYRQLNSNGIPASAQSGIASWPDLPMIKWFAQDFVTIQIPVTEFTDLPVRESNILSIIQTRQTTDCL